MRLFFVMAYLAATRLCYISSMNTTILEQRNDAIALATKVLPGSIAYHNIRPINVSQRFDGQTLLDVVVTSHPQIDRQTWLDWFAQGHILQGETPVEPNRRVRGGQQYDHLFPDTIEPDVDANIRVIYEDSDLVVVDKPAPLPMHPSGRFNKNSLTSILSSVYDGERLLTGHRLDANTTGVVLFLRNKDAARIVQSQFDAGQVAKTYLARCWGHPADDTFVCEAPIAREPGRAGRRVVDVQTGLPSKTEFSISTRHPAGTCDVVAKPLTGRTNQIRIHLWHSGYPICGDPTYLPDHQLGVTQTRRLQDPPMCLHAAGLQLNHPRTGAAIEFRSQRTPQTLNW
ncbi:Ribosomal large subunit pseudouridine synthase A [Planctomycetes bacterium K23_9]|uniref:Ribosomal large subunit pseudouridine synthase A n=2 Tax=Stieleria marina TaxID=1930275 RepID=A0A517NX10_9BACT|nr:Ribosomal large subunit pseudouridine synthase A [Planctomycetes bacterium K23_9]